MEKEKTKKQGGSPAGYHFFTTYQDCPRKFFIKYCLKIERDEEKDVLSYGTAIHAAKEEFYRNFKTATARSMFLKFKSLSSEYNKKEENLWTRGEKLLNLWFETYAAYEREHFDILEVEKESIVRVQQPETDIEFVFTIKPDVVYRDKRTGNVLVRDTKTSSWGIPQVISNFEAQDQCTSYIYGLNKLHPEWKVRQAEVEVLYARASVVKVDIGTAVYRTEKELSQFEEGLYGLISEISQKVKNIGGYSEFFLFPRRGKCDGDAGWKCEYREICRQSLGSDYIPLGYCRGVSG